MTLTLARRESLWGLAFISPWLLGAIVFTLLPMGASFVISLTNFDPRYPDAIHTVGLANYARLISDPLVLQSLGVTLKFAAVMIPLTIGVSLALAILLNSPRLVGRSIFRTLFYVPMQIPLVATALIWQGVLNLHTGWLNLALGTVGIAGPDWLNSTFWVYPGLSLISLWGTGNMMLIALAGLQSVPTELYEAARMDGAGRWAQLRHITLPMVSPVLFYNLIIALIGTSQYFTQAYVLTNGRGDPDNATLFFNLNLYREGWRYYDMGYAATLAWLLFGIVLMITLILFRTRGRWVYEGSER
jgi:ABC-type sugar transport system permease subunit